LEATLSLEAICEESQLTKHFASKILSKMKQKVEKEKAVTTKIKKKKNS